MDYKRLINTQVRAAFRKLGTLAIDVKLDLAADTTFDFSNQTATPSKVTTITIKGVPVTEVHKSKDSKQLSTTTLKTLMFLSSEIGNPDIYDKATIGGEVYKPVAPYETDGYTTTINFAKEL